MSVIPNVIYDQLNHNSLVPTSLHPQLVDQSIWHPVGITEDIPVRIRNSFVPVNFVVLEMDVCHQVSLILGRPFLSTTGATIDVAARIIKLNFSRKEETSTFKPEGTEKCNQVMVTIRPERDAMSPNKKFSAAENFSTKFSRRVKNATPVATRSLAALANQSSKVWRQSCSQTINVKVSPGGKPVVISFQAFASHSSSRH
jgi:hypothetical protein